MGASQGRTPVGGRGIDGQDATTNMRRDSAALRGLLVSLLPLPLPLSTLPPPPVPLLAPPASSLPLFLCSRQVAKVRNQLEYEEANGRKAGEALQAKEAELEAERRALAARQQEEQKFAKEGEAAQVGVSGRLAGWWGGWQGRCTRGWAAVAADPLDRIPLLPHTTPSPSPTLTHAPAPPCLPSCRRRSLSCRGRWGRSAKSWRGWRRS